MICDRCKKHAYFLEKCNYCSKAACPTCLKSIRRAHKVKRLVICKSCWSNIPSRKKFLSEGAPPVRGNFY